MKNPNLRPLSLLACAALTAGLTVGCDQKPQEKDLAPQAAALTADAKTEDSQTFEIAKADSKVTFEMDAELEEIKGRAPGSASGAINVDLMDISKTTGLVKIDLFELTLFQRKRGSADEEFGEETKSEKQNEHMQAWLEIAEDAPAEQREKNRYAEFKIAKVAAPGGADISKMKGGERKVALEISGSIRLHGRVAEHNFPAEAIFTYDGEKVTGVHVKTTKPLNVSLEKHDVRPRTAFNVLADKTLDALGAKVAKVAQVSLDISARVK